jgi:hypothetical protein
VKEKPLLCCSLLFLGFEERNGEYPAGNTHAPYTSTSYRQSANWRGSIRQANSVAAQPLRRGSSPLQLAAPPYGTRARGGTPL